jgi:hypothetical protein
MIEIRMKIPEYIRENGLQLNWDGESEVEVRIDNKEVLLFANKSGLLSLANLLVNLSQDRVPSGEHIHLDPLNSLEDGSIALIIGRK